MRIVAYCRVSSKSQVESQSLEHQFEQISNYCQSKGFEIVSHVQDAGFSGKNLEREGIQKVLKMIDKKAVDAVIVYSLSRLSRSSSCLSILLESMLKRNVLLLSITEPIDMSISGLLTTRILVSVAEAQRLQSNALIRSAFDHIRRAENKKVYCHITPYGYTKDGQHLIENEIEQEAIKIMVDMRNDGLPFYKIADVLNEKGYPTRKGAEWHFSSVRAILLRLPKMMSKCA